MNKHMLKQRNNIKNRKRKSLPMSSEEHTEFAAWVGVQPTKVDAAFTLKITRSTLDSILAKGSGKPENIKRINTIVARDRKNRAA